MEKFVILVENGMVSAVYGCSPSGNTDIEILDMDTTDPEIKAIMEERLGVVQQYLPRLY